MKVGDLTANVRAKLANRGDLTPDIPRWISDAVLELTGSYAFEELRETGPSVNFVPQQSECLESAFVLGTHKITQMVNWFVELDPSSHVGFNLKYRSPAMVEPMSRIVGIPCRWTRVGAKLIVGFKPDKSYATQIRYQYEHPFSSPVSVDDPILMPNDWREIVEYAAAERGSLEKRMIDYGTSYHDILYGDPEFQKSGGTKGAPGLIFKRVSQMERDMANNERQLAPVVQRY